MKLQIGDEIKWNLPLHAHVPSSKILDIDTSRPPTNINGHFLDNHVLVQFIIDKKPIEIWAYNYDILNQQLALGKISIIKQHNFPYIKRFSFL